MSIAKLPCAEAFIATLSGLSWSITKAMFVPVTIVVWRTTGDRERELLTGVSSLKHFIGGWYLGVRMSLWNYFLRKTIFRLINNLLPHIYFLMFETFFCLFVFVLFCFPDRFFASRNNLSGSRVRVLHVVFLVTVVTESGGGDKWVWKCKAVSCYILSISFWCHSIKTEMWWTVCRDSCVALSPLQIKPLCFILGGGVEKGHGHEGEIKTALWSELQIIASVRIF